MTERPDTIELSGALTMVEVPEVHARHGKRFRGRSIPATVSLAGVDTSDSSALALLIEWQALASAAGQRIEFESPPDGLRVIARLTGVDDMLGWRELPAPPIQKDAE